MSKIRLFYLLVPCLLAGFLFLYWVFSDLDAAAATTSCTVPGSHVTVQAAVNDPACAVINVAPGTFTENVVVSRDVAIQGSGINSTIVDGNDNGTVFDIQPGLSVTLSGLAVRNGRSLTTPYSQGGGIRVFTSTLTVIDTLITTNSADFGAGIYSYASTIVVHQSQVTNNSAIMSGGGIAGVSNSLVDIANSVISENRASNGICGGIQSTSSALTLGSSSLRNNSALSGAGICNISSTMTVSNSTLNDNWFWNNGGGIYNLDGVLTVNNSTLTDNRSIFDGSGGGIYVDWHNDGSVVTLNNSTLNNNSGGVYINSGSLSTLTMTASIIAGSTGADCYGTVISQGYNIASDGSCNLNGSGDMNNTDPLLGALQGNGGPTLTHLPLTGSPAIDAGDPLNCPATDQRGAPRPFDGDEDGEAVCDIGAVEFLSPVPSHYVVNLPMVAKP